MAIQFSILTPLLFMLSLLFLSIGFLLRNTWDRELKLPITLFFVFAAIWCAGDAVFYIFTDAEFQLAAATISFIGIALIPVALFLIAFAYAGMGPFFTLRKKLALFIIPGITIMLVATNSHHYLFYSGVTRQYLFGTVIWEVSYGPLYPIHIIYSFFLVATSIGILLYTYTGSTSLIRRQIAWLFLGILVPLTVNLLHILRIDPYPGLDWTPFALIFTAGILVSGHARIRLFSIVPLARDRIIESMEDGIIVLDRDYRIIDMNKSATLTVGETFRDVEGTDGTAILNRWGSPDPKKQSVLVHRKIDNRTFEVRSHRLRDKIGNEYGVIIFIRDITEVYRARKSLEEANKKLNLLSSITRHDILNQITAILGYGSIIREELPDDPEIQNYMSRLNAAVRTIQRQISFTADYENLGMADPVWQHAETVIHRAMQETDTGSIPIEVKTGNLEIYSDPLFFKVFANLFQNTIHHAEGAAKIIIWFEKRGDDGVLVVEDDGIGIPENMKERIFTHIRGSKMGLGLFLIREILSITGMGIQETGTYGEGARFEIFIPEDTFRNAPEKTGF